uniref:Wsv209-like protein n=1 Tax=Metapenaeus ensis majanivirus TaxID=2984279 RepID=A0A9C7BI53_9VIRU|nr:MAG: wsv209-like protein [Metapenaeus ensis majanivirus]
MTNIPEYTDIIPNPFDINNKSLVHDVNVTTGFFLGGQEKNSLPHDFASIDCHSNVVQCDPNNVKSLECHKCNTIGGGICLDASHLSNQLGLSSNRDKNVVGICVPRASMQKDLEDDINHFTTDIVLGIVGDYTHRDQDNNQPIEQMYITRKTICKDERIARKNTQMVKANPLAEGSMNCDQIVMCGGEDTGYPIHPHTKKVINHIDYVDFDIIQEASLLTCGCAEGYEMTRDPTSSSNLATCKPGPKKRQRGLSCPVTLVDYDDGTTRCVCNPATQVSLYEVTTSLEKGGLSTDYSTDMILALAAFQDKLLDGADACIPKPGVDPRVSAFGYSFAAHVFYDSNTDENTLLNTDENTLLNTDENTNQFRLEHNRGGHLMTGGLVRRSGVTRGGQWLSVIENDKEGGGGGGGREKEASYSIGGTSPFLGTGSIPAHVWGGDVWNDNNIIVGDLNNGTVIHPNATLKVVPPSTTGIPGVGVTLEHAVGMIVSAGRCYPHGVYRRGGQLSGKDCGINSESCFLSPVKNMDKDNPLTQMMSTNDPGTCAAAFIVPFFHDKCQTDYEKYPLNARLPQEAQTQRLGGWTGHYHVRPIALAMGYTPLERLFRFYCSTTKTNLEFPDKVMSMFPHMIPTNLDIMEWQRLFDYDKFGRVDLLGGLFVQPTTIVEDGQSSLNTKWTEEMISTNLPCLINHYQIDDARALSPIERSKLNESVYTRYPTASNIVANQTNGYSGYSLSGRNKMTNHSSSLSFLRSVIFGAENVIWNDPGFTPLALPQDIPVATLPEEIRYSKRNDSFGLSKSSLSNFQNKYATFENEPFQLALEENDNVYNPPAVQSHVVDAIFPAKYINNWIPGRADGSSSSSSSSSSLLVPSLNLAEAFFRMRPFCSRGFFANKPHMLQKDWGSNPHTSGDLFQGIASAPCSKYEMGGYWGYPSSGSLVQYLTLLSPRSFDTGPYRAAHATAAVDATTDQNLLLLNTLKKSKRENSTLLIKEALDEKCDCLTDIFCTSKNDEKKRAVVAATPSRGNRFASYLFCRSTPKHYMPLMYSLLRLENRDPNVTRAILENNLNVLENIKATDWNLPVAPNRFTAVRTNAAFTRFFAREPIIPYSPVVSLSSSSSSSLPIDYHDDSIIERDDWQYNVPIGQPAYLLATNEQGHLIHKRLVDFFESACRISPNTTCSDTFSAWHEGPKGIVSMYGTPIMGDDLKNETKDCISSPMRMIHSFAINIPYMGGFECGQTAAEGMLTRGLEMWYHPFIKPPLSATTTTTSTTTTTNTTTTTTTTTLEGIRAKTQEPFERLAIRGFREIDWFKLIKYSLLSHYGIDGLVSFAYTDKTITNNSIPIRMTNGSARYPFACQSDRVPFPLTMQMTIQMRALLDMGVNKELVFRHLSLEEQNQIISN